MSSTADAAEVLRQGHGTLQPVRFPPGWTLSGSWHRAQAARPNQLRADPGNQAQYIIRLGYVGDRSDASFHRLTFTIRGGELMADCSCPAWQYDRWCAHIAAAWWAWVRGRIDVLDADSGRSYRLPPAWLRLEDAEVEDR